MKKLFLIPLMTLVCSVAAWGIPRTAGTFDELKMALSEASEGDVIELTADIAYPTNGKDLLNITQSITLDGKGHKISGYGSRSGNPNTIVIQPSNIVDVTIKNVNIYSTQYRVFETRGNLHSLTLSNVNIESVCTSTNPQTLTISCDAGKDNSTADITIENCSFKATKSGYPVITFMPVNLDISNTSFSGYCSLYFKSGGSTTPGSAGSIINADACDFDAPNVHSGQSNAFAVFALETTNLEFNLNNCSMNAQKYGDQSQDVFSMSEWTPLSKRDGDIKINLSGDNTHFSTSSSFIGNTYYYGQVDGAWVLISNENKDDFNFSGKLIINLTGGTYSVDPREISYYKTFYWEDESLEANLGGVTIPDGYEVSEVKQGGVTLYRIVKSAAEKEPGVKYDLNDLVAGEGEAEGNNPVSSFDLSTGEEMELNQETTTAGYVQVSDNGSDATVIKVGKVEDEEKVDQTLVINNGLDVSGDSRVEVQPGSALVIGEGGINTEKPENIVIEADKEGAASLLLDPTITVNQTPELTVKMTAQQVGYKPKTSDPSKYDYYWHRFAMPVDQIDALPREPYVGTSIKFWDFTIGTQGDWADIPSLGAMKPFIGYNLCPASAPQDVVYTFKGKLVGNTNNPLEFSKRGFNFFGNSYTGYISLKQLTDMILGDASLEGTVWVWNTTTQTYSGVSLTTLKNKPSMYEDWQKEVAPMHTFILKLESDELPEMEINYASAIWGNPRYSAVTGVASAPARYNEVDDPAVRIEIAANGKKDFVLFYESAELSDAFDNGYDASKFMNEGTINAYSTITGVNFSTVATNNLEGKTISLNTNDEVSYTLSFSYVSGEDYALEDVVTGKVIAIKEGTTYEFAAQPNSVVADRFRIVGAHKVPTSVETTEVKNSVKGIYTVLGQYVGEDFHTLPSGVYVVDGVKIVK